MIPASAQFYFYCYLYFWEKGLSLGSTCVQFKPFPKWFVNAYTIFYARLKVPLWLW